MIEVNDRWLRIALVAIPCSLFLHDFIVSDSGARQANIIYILTAILVCEGSRFLCYSSRRWFTGLFKNVKRLSTLIPAGILFVASTFVVSKALRNYIAYGEFGMDASIGSVVYVNNQQVKMGVIGMSVIYATITFLLLLAIYDLAYHFARSRHTERQRDRLEKEKLHAELLHLKGIVNPHFLFNNLNSLSSLITENPAQAEDFLNELTKVFRYLLRNNETELTTLGEELQFLRSYYSLLETRYGIGIAMNVKIDSVYESFLLPPLTLQLLVENAVKHNRVQKEDPLRIELFVDKDNLLVVRNNISLKDQSVDSTGIGLRNINSRYKLLNYQPPIIHKNDEFFSVIISLIPSADTRPADHSKPITSTATSTLN
ncbi:MAG TPA: histidine kinase [Flavitalea sp.]|nr:histidine kinase [Flavitalea sp.]